MIGPYSDFVVDEASTQPMNPIQAELDGPVVALGRWVNLKLSEHGEKIIWLKKEQNTKQKTNFNFAARRPFFKRDFPTTKLPLEVKKKKQITEKTSG